MIDARRSMEFIERLLSEVPAHLRADWAPTLADDGDVELRSASRNRRFRIGLSQGAIDDRRLATSALCGALSAPDYGVPIHD